MKNTNRPAFIFMFIMVAAILGNYMFFPHLIGIQVFTAFYVILIYFIFKPTLKDYIYYTTFLLALMGSTFRLPLGGSVGVNYYYITLFIYLVIIFLEYLSDNGGIPIRSILKNKYSLFLTIFVVYMIAWVPFVESKGLALRALKMYIIMIPLMIGVIHFNKDMDNFKKTLKLLAIIYPAFLLLGSLEINGIKWGLENSLQDKGLWDLLYYKRIPVLFYYNQNNYAVFIVLGMAFIFSRYIYATRTMDRIYYILLYVVSQINLTFTTGRIAWITVLILFIFAFGTSLILRIKSIGINAARFGAITIIVFFISSFIPTMIPYFGKMRSTPILKYAFVGTRIFGGGEAPPVDENIAEGTQHSVAVRKVLLEDVVKGVVAEKHYLGFGTGNIPTYLEKVNNTGGILIPHSLWFEIMGDFGIPMFIYSIVIYTMMMYELLKIYLFGSQKVRAYGLTFLIASFCFVFLAFAPSSVIGYTIFWMLMGLCLGLVLSNDSLSGLNSRESIFRRS